MDRFLPDGNTEIIFNLSENPQFIYDNETLQAVQTCQHTWVSGVRTRPITIPSGRGSRMLVVAFKKGKASPFYPMPMSEIADEVVEAEVIFGRDVRDLRERLLAAPTIQLMFSLVERFILQRAGESLSPDMTAECVEYAVSTITSRPSKLGIQRLSEEIGYSQKHFTTLFKKQVGVSPGQYTQIMRFQKTILAIEKDESIHWSEIALRQGYYDQAHFIHEFRHFSGFTPGEYLTRKTDLLNYIPVG
jgi:AraC-like DNA-binding protein